MRTLRLAPAVLGVALAACGGSLPEDFEEDVDDLSAATVSMEMVRANPQLAPGVELPEGRPVVGRPKPVGDDTGRDGPSGKWDRGGWNWLYDANGLAQFLQLADPAAHKDDTRSATYARKPGDLYADDGAFTWLDVEQGSIGDCYFAAALSSVLQARPALAKSLIKPRKKGGKIVSYYVYFYQAKGRKVRIEVDPDLLHRNSSGSVLYMRSTQTQPGYQEWAPSLVEKAYAKWHGSYQDIGDGGYASDAMFALNGKRTRSYSGTSRTLPDAIERGARARKAMTACTYGDKDGVKYDGTGVYSEHCYTVRGIRRAGAERFVQLRNPWGPGEGTEPTTDGEQDGLFELPLATFQKLFASADIER